jgi:uncharacterized protein YbjT (DUF2867 family)
MPLNRAAAAVLLWLLPTAAFAAGEMVLVAGASGQSGRPTIDQLQDAGYKVRALVRDASKGADLGVELAVGDVMKPESLGAALQGVTYVISTIGSSNSGYSAEQVEFTGIANLARAAKAAGIKHFVLMSSLKAGSEDMNEFLNAKRGMLLMWKGKGEQALRDTGMPYTIVRPGGLLPRPGQSCEVGKVGLKLAPMDGVGMGMVCRADVAAIMIAVLGNRDAMGKTFSVVQDEQGTPGNWKTAFASLAKD